MKKSFLLITPALLVALILALGVSSVIYSYCLIRDTGQVSGQVNCCDGKPRRWQRLPIPITINRTGSKQAPGQRTIDAVQRAMETWKNVPSAFIEFSLAGLTDQDRPGRDNVNIVVFDTAGVNFAQGSNVLAFSNTWTDNSSNAIESDLVFNARDFQWSDNPSQSQFDIETTALHELGHHLGLSHAGGGRDTGVTNSGSAGCGPPIPQAVMWYAGPAGERKRNLHPDDIAGVTDLYPNWVLEGIVIDGTSGSGIAEAQVSFDGALASADTAAFTAIPSDDLGLFSAVVDQAAFKVSVSAFGLRGQEVEISFTQPGHEFTTLTMSELPKSAITGSIRDADTGAPIAATMKLFNSDGLLQQTQTNASGQFTFANIPITDAPTTAYDRIVVEPAVPYPVAISTQEITVAENQPTVFDFELTPAEVLIIDDDGGDQFEGYFIAALDSLAKSYVNWEVASRGSVANSVSLFSQKTVVWFTGNNNATLISEATLDSLRSHLARGGTLFATGQHLAKLLQARGSSFLSEIFKSDWGGEVLRDPILDGVAGDPIGSQLTRIAIAGGDGARNQSAPDLLLPAAGADASIVFDLTQNTVAGVRIEEAISGVSGSRAVLFGFGLEGMNNLAPGFATREQTMAVVLNWLAGISTEVAERARESGPVERWELIGNYPNPFNGQTIIHFRIPSVVNSTTVNLTIYDVLGRRVKSLVAGELPAGEHRLAWDGKNDAGVNAGSGTYFYRLTAGDNSSNAGSSFVQVRKMVYLQ